MTYIEGLAIVLYSAGGVFALFGPGIATVRVVRKNMAAQSLENSNAELKLLVPRKQAEARADAWWGVAEFSLVALGVVFASVASILLVAQSAT